MSIWEELPQPFFVLAPMDDVTDTVFRQIVGSCAPPDLYFTEFVNVDGLQSPGRSALLKKLQFIDKETPIIAQVWGKNPENYYKTVKELKEMGFAGVDINMGCPVKTVIKNGCCSALINNRELAGEIIDACREGAGPPAGGFPISVKTRLGFKGVDFSWHESLLSKTLNALTIHGRTVAQLSNVPADWDAIRHIRELRDSLSPDTKIIGNGDVLTREQGLELANMHRLDGIMVGRGIFQDPFVFARTSPWEDFDKEQRVMLYRRHIELFMQTWQHGERPIHTLNKFCKIYINGFDGAKELREKLMSCQSGEELLRTLDQA